MQRRKSRAVFAGTVAIGGNAPVSVQSMLNIPAQDVPGNVRQARELEAAGCDLIRTAVPTLEDVRLIPALKEAVHCPIIADIHFDYRIALACVEAGVDKIRINPGNIGEESHIRAVADACRDKKIPIRIGVNSGSVEKDLLCKYGGPTPQALTESALRHVSLLEKCGFYDMVISVKASSASAAFEAYQEVASRCDYPLHLGVTEAGTEKAGVLKSSAAIGGLLLSGIGDTIRISLTADPVREVEAARQLLSALELRREGPTVISCPTCGRTKIDLITLTAQVEQALSNCSLPIHVAVMGCAVNGPGEASEADYGIAGGDGCGLVFKKGKIVRKVQEDELLPALLAEIQNDIEN